MTNDESKEPAKELDVTGAIAGSEHKQTNGAGPHTPSAAVDASILQSAHQTVETNHKAKKRP